MTPAFEAAEIAALGAIFGSLGGTVIEVGGWTVLSRPDRPGHPWMHQVVARGDVSTYDLAVGATVADLRAGTTGAGLDVQPGDELVAPSFRLQDQSSGLYGTLTSGADDGTVTGVVAGQACGE